MTEWCLDHDQYKHKKPFLSEFTYGQFFKFHRVVMCDSKNHTRIFTLDHQTHYILRLIRKMRSSNLHNWCSHVTRKKKFFITSSINPPAICSFESFWSQVLSWRKIIQSNLLRVCRQKKVKNSWLQYIFSVYSQETLNCMKDYVCTMEDSVWSVYISKVFFKKTCPSRLLCNILFTILSADVIVASGSYNGTLSRGVVIVHCTG